MQENKIIVKKQLDKRMRRTKNDKVVYKAGAVFRRGTTFYRVQEDGSWRKFIPGEE